MATSRPLPMDLHKHVMLARIFHGHVPDLDDLAPRSGETVFTATHLALKLRSLSPSTCPSSRRASGS